MPGSQPGWRGSRPGRLGSGWLGQPGRFADLVPGVVTTPAVKQNQKQEMFMLFQANALGDGDKSEEAKEKATNLQRIFGMPVTA